MLLRRKAGLPTEWEHLNTARSIPAGSKPWVRAHRASLALLPQRSRHNETRTGANVHREPAPIFSVLSPLEQGRRLAHWETAGRPTIPPCSVGYPGRSREWLRPRLFRRQPLRHFLWPNRNHRTLFPVVAGTAATSEITNTPKASRRVASTRSRGFTPRRHGHAGRANLNSVVWFWW